MNSNKIVQHAERMLDHADSDNASVDDRVSHALEEYAASLEKGQPLSRESLLEKYADVAEELAGCLDSLDFIRDVAPQIAGQRPNDDDAAKQTTDQRRVTVGDYRIIREIGRGGMGVVYEAEQLSLGRNVALKVLPYAAMMDQKSITRFKNEARAAATLDHPHIVPVFAVGVDRGIHYYAMSLIDGLTVAELVSHLQHSITDGDSSTDRLSIDDFLGHHGEPSGNLSGSHLEPTIDSCQLTKKRTDEPTDHADETYRDVEAAISTHRSRFDGRFFRSVARLGAQAAEALDHAHQHGIVHRDIKPGNLMIDAGTKLWVTDFGLARIESDPGMTMTGDLVGTLRYMAPEQALAKRVVVDNRADIYSLGASLYEMLAFRPPFDGPSRDILLKQIAFEEPKPLRHLNRAVPEDLQTIVHKALSKSPDDRYATAEEMADDLNAFVDDEPIKARPLSMAQLAARWGARRKGLVAAIAGVLILAVIGLLISNAMIAHERNVAHQAQRSERTERLAADRQRNLADLHAKQARETVDTFLTKVSEDELLNAPSMQPLRQELLELALNYYNKFIQQQPEDPEVQSGLADAYANVGRITSWIGSETDALNAHQKALAIREKLAVVAPTNHAHRNDLASSKLNIALSLEAVGKINEALDFYQESLEIRLRLVEERPDVSKYQSDLALSHLELAKYHGLVQHDKGLSHYDSANAIFERLLEQHPNDPEKMNRLGVSYNGMAGVYWRLGQTTDAKLYYERSIAIVERLVEKSPDVQIFRSNLSSYYSNLASLYRAIGQSEVSLDFYKKAISFTEQLVHENPLVSLYQDILAELYFDVADADVSVEPYDMYRKAIEIREKLVDVDPGVIDSQAGLAKSYVRFAMLIVRRDGPTEESLSLLRDAVDILEQLVDQNPEVSQYQMQLATTYHNSSIWYMQSPSGQPKTELDLRRKAIAIYQRIADQNPEMVEQQAALANSYLGLSRVLNRLGRSEEASSSVQRAITIFERLVNQVQDVVLFQSRLVDSYRSKAEIYDRLGRRTDALAINQKVITILERKAELDRSPADWGDLGQLYYRTDQFTEAKHALEKSLQLRGETEPTIKLGPRWWYMAMVLARTGETGTARGYYDRLVSEIVDFTAADTRFRDELAALLGIEEPEPAPADGVSVSPRQAEQRSEPTTISTLSSTIPRSNMTLNASRRRLGLPNFHTVVGRSQGFANVLEAKGYQVHIHSSSLTADALQKLDLLVIANARSIDAGSESLEFSGDRLDHSAFSQVEIESLVVWLRHGGSLLSIEDNKPWGGAAKKLARRWVSK